MLDAERRIDKGRADRRSDDEGRGRSRSRSPNGGGARTDDSYNHNIRVSTSPSLDATPGKFLNHQSYPSSINPESSDSTTRTIKNYFFSVSHYLCA